jgi:hypothetical protein
VDYLANTNTHDVADVVSISDGLVFADVFCDSDVLADCVEYCVWHADEVCDVVAVPPRVAIRDAHVVSNNDADSDRLADSMRHVNFLSQPDAVGFQYADSF